MFRYFLRRDFFKTLYIMINKTKKHLRRNKVRISQKRRIPPPKIKLIKKLMRGGGKWADETVDMTEDQKIKEYKKIMKKKDQNFINEFRANQMKEEERDEIDFLTSETEDKKNQRINSGKSLAEAVDIDKRYRAAKTAEYEKLAKYKELSPEEQLEERKKMTDQEKDEIDFLTSEKLPEKAKRHNSKKPLATAIVEKKYEKYNALSADAKIQALQKMTPREKDEIAYLRSEGENKKRTRESGENLLSEFVDDYVKELEDRRAKTEKNRIAYEDKILQKYNVLSPEKRLEERNKMTDQEKDEIDFLISETPEEKNDRRSKNIKLSDVIHNKRKIEEIKKEILDEDEKLAIHNALSPEEKKEERKKMRPEEREEIDFLTSETEEQKNERRGKNINLSDAIENIKKNMTPQQLEELEQKQNAEDSERRKILAEKERKDDEAAPPLSLDSIYTGDIDEKNQRVPNTNNPLTGISAMTPEQREEIQRRHTDRIAKDREELQIQQQESEKRQKEVNETYEKKLEKKQKESEEYLNLVKLLKPLDRVKEYLILVGSHPGLVRDKDPNEASKETILYDVIKKSHDYVNVEAQLTTEEKNAYSKWVSMEQDLKFSNKSESSTQSKQIKPTQLRGTRRASILNTNPTQIAQQSLKLKRELREKAANPAPIPSLQKTSSIAAAQVPMKLNEELTNSISEKYNSKMPLSAEENKYLDGLKENIRIVLENKSKAQSAGNEFINPYSDDEIYTIYKLAKKFTAKDTAREQEYINAERGKVFEKGVKGFMATLMETAMEEIVKTISELKLAHLDDALTNSIRDKIKNNLALDEAEKKYIKELKHSIDAEKKYIEELKHNIEAVSEDKNSGFLDRAEYRTRYTREQLYTIYELATLSTEEQMQKYKEKSPTKETIAENIIETISVYVPENSGSFNLNPEEAKVLFDMNTPEGQKKFDEMAKLVQKKRFEESRRVKDRHYLTVDSIYVYRPTKGGSKNKRKYTSKIRR